MADLVHQLWSQEQADQADWAVPKEGRVVPAATLSVQDRLVHQVVPAEMHMNQEGMEGAVAMGEMEQTVLAISLALPVAIAVQVVMLPNWVVLVVTAEMVARVVLAGL